MLLHLRCPLCDDTITVTERLQPVRFAERDADAIDPRSFVVTGGDTLLHRCILGDNVRSKLPPARLPARVHQASGMVAAQVGCTCDEAIALMRERGTAGSMTLDEIAYEIVQRRLQFGP